MPDKPNKPLSKEDSDTLHTGEAAQNFLQSKFGQFYIGVLRSAADSKLNEMLAPAEINSGVVPLDGLAQVLRAESAKGAILGIRFAIESLEGMVIAAANLRKEKALPAGED